jgi:hypothetical protein
MRITVQVLADQMRHCLTMAAFVLRRLNSDLRT